MFLLSDFSNAARKVSTLLKKAKLLGGGKESYVDAIQVARRGKKSYIDSPYYISRNSVMTHPHDNKVLVAGQKELQKIAGSDTYEYGMKGFRPKDNSKLRLGGIAVGTENSVDLAISRPDDYYKGKKPKTKEYKDILSIHTHPNKDYYPSQADLSIDYNLRKKNKKKYESLIFVPTLSRGQNNAPYSMTQYKQIKPLGKGEKESVTYHYLGGAKKKKQ